MCNNDCLGWTRWNAPESVKDPSRPVSGPTKAKQFQGGREKVSCPGLDLDQTHIKDRTRGKRARRQKENKLLEV